MKSENKCDSDAVCIYSKTSNNGKGMILEVTGKGGGEELGLEVLNINDLSPSFLPLKTSLKGTN